MRLKSSIFTVISQHKHFSSNKYKIDAVKSDDGGEYQCAVNFEFCGIVKSNPLNINGKDSVCSSANVYM